MILKTMWGKRASGPGETPELMVAWDEFCFDSYPEGFEEDCEKERQSWDDDLAAWRMIDIEVSLSAIDAAFKAAQVNGHVKDQREETT